MDVRLARRVAMARTAVGAGAVLLPRLMGTLFFDAEEAKRPASRALGRLFGIRDVALGLGALRAIEHGEGEELIGLGMACDVADAAALLAGTGKLPTKTVILGAGLAAVFAYASKKAMDGVGSPGATTA